MFRCLGIALLLTFGSISFAAAAEPKDAEPTDPDFKLQGEYSGMILTLEGQKKLGVQIIALGGGKFHAVGFMGGLPGDGWDGSERKESDGDLKDGGAVFATQEYTSVAKDGTLAINVAGAPIGELKRIER